jgi:hypothetical protein
MLKTMHRGCFQILNKKSTVTPATCIVLADMNSHSYVVFGSARRSKIRMMETEKGIVLLGCTLKPLKCFKL